MPDFGRLFLKLKYTVITQNIRNTLPKFGPFLLGHSVYIYRVSQEECAILRESVPYVKVYRYNPKHLYPKLNGYGDNGQRKVWTSCISGYCNSTAVSPLTLQPTLPVFT